MKAVTSLLMLTLSMLSSAACRVKEATTSPSSSPSPCCALVARPVAEGEYLSDVHPDYCLIEGIQAKRPRTHTDFLGIDYAEQGNVTRHTIPGERSLLYVGMMGLLHVIDKHGTELWQRFGLRADYPSISFDTADFELRHGYTAVVRESECTDDVIILVSSQTAFVIAYTASLFTRVFSDIGWDGHEKRSFGELRALIHHEFAQRPELSETLADLMMYQVGDVELDNTMMTHFEGHESEVVVALAHAMITFIVMHEYAHTLLPELDFSVEYAADLVAHVVVTDPAFYEILELEPSSDARKAAELAVPIVLSMLRAHEWLLDFKDRRVTPPPFPNDEDDLQYSDAMNPRMLERILAYSHVISSEDEDEQSAKIALPLSVALLDVTIPVLSLRYGDMWRSELEEAMAR